MKFNQVYYDDGISLHPSRYVDGQLEAEGRDLCDIDYSAYSNDAGNSDFCREQNFVGRWMRPDQSKPVCVQ